MAMDNLQIIFIHEIGHHIANELNARVFSFNRRTESILLYPSNHGDFFDGKTKIANTNTDFYQVENTVLEYIRTFYGCLFECLFRQIEISKCLCEVATESDVIDNLCKGRVDYHQMAQMTMTRKVKNRFDWWRYLTVEYFTLMKNKVNEFDGIFELKPLDYILKEENSSYEIDIDRLNVVLEPFFITHQKDFKKAVEDLRELNSKN